MDVDASERVNVAGHRAEQFDDGAVFDNEIAADGSQDAYAQPADHLLAAGDIRSDVHITGEGVKLTSHDVLRPTELGGSSVATGGGSSATPDPDTR